MASGSKVVFVRSPSIGVYPRKKKPGTAEDRFSGRGVCCQKNSQPLEDRYRLRPAMLTTCTVRLRSTGAIIQKDISIALQGARSLSKRMPAPMPETLTSARSATRSAPTSRHLLRNLGTLLPLLTAQQLRRVADSIPSRYGDLNQQRVLVSARSVR